MRVRRMMAVFIVAGVFLLSSLSGAGHDTGSPPQQQKPDPATSPGEKKPAPPDATPKPQTPSPDGSKAGGAPPVLANAYASTYQPAPAQPTLIRNATILTAAGPLIERGSILLQNGKVAAVGPEITAPAGALVVE